MPLRRPSDPQSAMLPWRRRWVRYGQPVPIDHDGFLAPNGTSDLRAPRISGAELRSLGDVADVPCIVALGDPGLGKSTALREHVEWLRRRDASARVVAHDLADIGSIELLNARIFRAPDVLDWRDSSGVLYCVLDSFDESPLPLETLRSALLVELEQLPLGRLRLVIACRTAAVPPGLVADLEQLFTPQRTNAPQSSVVPPSEADVDRGSSQSSGQAAAIGIASPPDRSMAEEDAPYSETPLTNDATIAAPTRSTPATDSPFLALEIVVLSRDDVRAAAVAILGASDDGAAFLRTVALSGAGAFAARPITLRALLRRYNEDVTLAASQADLYRDMCLELCDPVPARLGGVARSLRTSRDGRYWVSARLCAALLFSNRRGVFRGDGPTASPRLVDPRHCVGTEWLHGAPLRVDETVIAEALDTGLFTGEDNHLTLAAHQTFAEFAAADWLVHRGLETAQIVSLLHDPTDPERRVVPQLRQVAAWLAALHPPVFGAIAPGEPELVLWSDVVDVPLERRAGLVAALLTRANENRLQDPGFGMRAAYTRLAHPELATQLAPVVANRALPDRTRYLALEIARVCKVGALGTSATELALEEAEPLQLRVEAAVLVSRVGDALERGLLMALVDVPPTDDEADELFGAALLASWRQFRPDELFPLLRPPRRSNWGGTYSLALREIADVLVSAEGVEYALAASRWLAQNPDGSSLGALDDVKESALLLTLRHTDDPQVFSALLAYLRYRLQRHLPLGDSLGRQDSTQPRNFVEARAAIRRRIALALLNGLPANSVNALETTVDIPSGNTIATMGEISGQAKANAAGLGPATHDARWLTYDMPELLPPEDVPWALHELAALESNDECRQVWRDVLRLIYMPDDSTHVAAAFLLRRDPDVAAIGGEWLAHSASPEDARATFLRDRDAHRAEWAALDNARDAARQADESRRRIAPLEARLAPIIESFDCPPNAQPPGGESTSDGAKIAPGGQASEPSPWEKIFFELILNPSHGRYGAEPTAETLARLVSAMTAAQLNCVAQAAETFLRDMQPVDDPFPADGALPWRSLQGASAGEVLALLAPQRLRTLSAEVWVRWLPTFVRHEPHWDSPQLPPIATLLAEASVCTPIATGRALVEAVDHSLRDTRSSVSRQAMELACRFEHTAAELSRWLASGRYRPEQTEYLLRGFLQTTDPARSCARAAAAALIAAVRTGSARGRSPSRGIGSGASLRSPGEETAQRSPATAGPRDVSRQLAVAAAASLIAADDDAGWGIVGDRLETDSSFAHDVLLFGARYDALLVPGSLERLSEDRIAHLALLALRTFPPESDPWHVGVFSPGPRDFIRRWRDSLLSALEARASDAAVDALARIAAAEPGRDWLVQSWLRASAANLGSRWRGIPPRVLMRLSERPDARLVQSGEQLLDVLEESLGRLDDELQHEWRGVVGLWDQQRSGRWHLGWLPKDEGHLANEIARHLRRDLGWRGIVVGRELVIQVGVAGAAAGLRTDIDVRARPLGNVQRPIPEVRVIIEVKGSWHQDVQTAMQTQLVEDYLVPHDVRHGFFVVGYYTCAAWSNTAGKRRSRALGSLNQLAARLREQAQRVSSPFRTVRAFVINASLPDASEAEHSGHIVRG